MEWWPLHVRGNDACGKWALAEQHSQSTADHVVGGVGNPGMGMLRQQASSYDGQTKRAWSVGGCLESQAGSHPAVGKIAGVGGVVTFVHLCAT